MRSHRAGPLGCILCAVATACAPDATSNGYMAPEPTDTRANAIADTPSSPGDNDTDPSAGSPLADVGSAETELLGPTTCAVENCHNQTDDDGDGATDGADSDCEFEPSVCAAQAPFTLISIPGWGGKISRPAIAVDAAGTTHFVYYSVAMGNTLAYVERTAAGTMTEPVPIYDPVVLENPWGRPQQIESALAIDPTGTLHLVFTGDILADVFHATKAPGKGWSPPAPISGGADVIKGSTLPSPALAITPQGEVNVVFDAWVNSQGHVLHVAKAPSTTTWSSPVDIGTTDGNRSPSLAADAAGTLYLVAVGADMLTLVTRMKHLGGPWSPPLDIDDVTSAVPAGQLGIFQVGITARGCGEVHIAYQVMLDKLLEIRSLTLVTDQKTHWSSDGLVDAIENHTIYSNAPFGVAIAVDARGGVHTVYDDSTNLLFKHAYKPSGGTWSVPDIIDGVGLAATENGHFYAPGEGPAMVIAASGTAHVIWWSDHDTQISGLGDLGIVKFADICPLP